MVTRTLICWLCSLIVGFANGGESPRIPVGIATTSDGAWLFTANRDHGSVSVIRRDPLAVVAELPVGGRPAGLSPLGDDGLLVLDGAQGRLVGFVGAPPHFRQEVELPLPGATQFHFDPVRRVAWVTSRWLRKLTAVRVHRAGEEIRLEVAGSVDLPFAPGQISLDAKNGRVVVAGAFRAQLAVVAVDPLQLVAHHQIPGHNIGGMWVDAAEGQLCIAHQRLYRQAHTTRDDIHWGNLLENLLLEVPLSQLDVAKQDLSRFGTLHRLGGPNRGAGDPGAMIDARTLLLGGVHEVAFLDEQRSIVHRTTVGKRPIAGVWSSRDELLVANMFSDTVSILDRQYQLQEQLSLSPERKVSQSVRGEQLFFDAHLAHDGWMSCHSCHTDGHSNQMLNDNLSDGSFGTPKRVLSLLGAHATGPWGWNGQTKSLEEQVQRSVQQTMHGEAISVEQVDALVAFVRSLTPPAPAPPSNPTLVAQGQAVFERKECQRCHEPPHFTSGDAWDVGLADERGHQRFNPPSLRGVGLRDPLLHDGRAASLEQVFGDHHHPPGTGLTPDERRALLAFLRSL